MASLFHTIADTLLELLPITEAYRVPQVGELIKEHEAREKEEEKKKQETAAASSSKK